jgi:hypothetical protein
VTGGFKDTRFKVRYTDAARNDLLRLFDFLLDRGKTAQDFDDPRNGSWTRPRGLFLNALARRKPQGYHGYREDL